MALLSKKPTIFLTLCAALAFGACEANISDGVTTETEEGQVVYLDTHGDGQFDDVDSDADGSPDHYFDISTCELCQEAQPIAFCFTPVVDTNNDGRADGLDWNCDGVVDVWFNGGGGSGGSGGSGSGDTSSGGQCSTQSGINGQTTKIECSETSGTWDCTCSRNGWAVSECSTTSSSACSQPGNGNCCGF